MRGRPKPVEELLPEIWRVAGELKRLTEGLEEHLATHAKKEGDDARPDDR